MYIVISNTSGIAIYKQIYEQIKKQIICGDLQEGTALPSIRKLAKEIHVSVITTKKAFDELEKEKLVVSIGGKGTYVAPQNIEFIREQKMQQVEEKLNAAISEAKMLGLSYAELSEMLKLLFEED